MCKFPSFESLSRYWKSEIVVPAIPMYERERDIVIGMYHDPVEFIPKHMERWLERRELERSPLPPGFYKIKIKAILQGNQLEIIAKNCFL